VRLAERSERAGLTCRLNNGLFITNFRAQNKCSGNMITLMTKNEIISMLRQGFNESEIARKTGFSRTTVRKWAKTYKGALENVKSGEGCLEDFLCEKPRYDITTRSKRKLDQQMIEFIDKCLIDNIVKLRTGRKKQQMRHKDIYEQLIRNGHEISYVTVSNYATLSKQRLTQQTSSPEGFIKQYYIPGESCEFDWGEVHLTIGGRDQKLYLGAASFCSNGRWGALYHRQDTLSFMETHVAAFRYFGGVPGKMVYDNMRVAISQFTGNQKKPTDALVRMSAFYGFNYRFCNIASGNEKGHVERTVEVLRRKAFSIRDCFDTIDQANAYLLQTCDRLNARDEIRDKFIQEKNSLAPLVSEMACFEARMYKVDKLSTFCLNNSHYSVPSEYIKHSVWVKKFSEIIIIYDTTAPKKIEIARHERSYETKWVLNLTHYLSVLKTKPGALNQSVALQQAPQKIRDLYQMHFMGKERSFIELLIYAHKNNILYDELCKAALTARRKGVREVSDSHIKEILQNPAQEITTSVVPSQIAHFAIENLSTLTRLINMPS